jgi:hypothetical protein
MDIPESGYSKNTENPTSPGASPGAGWQDAAQDKDSLKKQPGTAVCLSDAVRNNTRLSVGLIWF